MLLKGYAQESMHLDLQMAAQQVQNLTFFVTAHVSSYDPGTHRIKAIIPTFTDAGSGGNGEFMETGWIQLGTVWSGNGFGLQVAPYGGANTTDISGQNNASTDNPVNPEQIVLMIISQNNTLMVGGVLTFNSVDVPPGTGQPLTDTYGNQQRIQLSSGEAIMRHSSGSYTMYRNDGSIEVSANTSPQIPFKEPDDSSLERDLNLNASVNLDSGAPNATTLTAATNINSIVGIPDKSASVPGSGTLSGSVNVTAATNGQGTNTGNSTIGLLANGENMTSTGAVNIQALASGKTVTNTIALEATSDGETQNTATGSFEVTANKTNGVAEMTISSTTDHGSATVDITAAGGSGTAGVNIAATGTDASIDIDSDQDINMSAMIVDVVSAEINCGTGTLRKVLNEVFADFFNNHTHSGVTTGGGTTGAPTVPADDSVFAQNLNCS